MFFLYVLQKKKKQKANERKTRAKENTVRLSHTSFDLSAAVSINYARAHSDRVTSDRCRGLFRFLLMLNEMRIFLKSRFFEKL